VATPHIVPIKSKVDSLRIIETSILFFFSLARLQVLRKPALTCINTFKAGMAWRSGELNLEAAPIARASRSLVGCTTPQLPPPRLEPDKQA
jgi:hypothetical protein